MCSVDSAFKNKRQNKYFCHSLSEKKMLPVHKEWSLLCLGISITSLIKVKCIFPVQNFTSQC